MGRPTDPHTKVPQRLPVNFWLLLAATICVDGVATLGEFRSEELYFPLVCGQLSALCIWTSFSRRRQYWRTLLTFAFAVAAALWAAPAYGPGDRDPAVAMAYAGLWLTHATFLFGVLWAFQRTRYARRWGYRENWRGWQFSTIQLLLIMTALAILIVVLRSAQLIHDVWLWVVILLVNNVCLAVACVVIQGTRWHAMVRLAAAAGVAVFMGMVLYATRTWPEIIAVNLIYAFVLVLWLEVGDILPRPAGPGHADAPGSSR